MYISQLDFKKESEFVAILYKLVCYKLYPSVSI